jgi:hypothetical protein
MKRFLMLVGVAVIAAAMYVAASPAGQRSSGPTARQFKALKAQVASLSKNLKAVKGLAVAEAGLLLACDQHAIPINDFGDFQNGAYGYHYLQPDGITEIKTTALDISSVDDTGAGWFTFGDSSCNTAVGGLRHNAAKAGIRLPHISSHSALLATHQH